MRYRKWQYLGNKWVAIDIEPADGTYARKVVAYLAEKYQFDVPEIYLALDGFFCDCHILDSNVMIDFSSWTGFTIAFENVEARDTVLAHLQSLPEHYFFDDDA